MAQCATFVIPVAVLAMALLIKTALSVLVGISNFLITWDVTHLVHQIIMEMYTQDNARV